MTTRWLRSRGENIHDSFSFSYKKTRPEADDVGHMGKQTEVHQEKELQNEGTVRLLVLGSNVLSTAKGHLGMRGKE